MLEVTLPATAGANASSNATNTALVVDDLGRTGNDTFNVTIVAAAPGVSHATATWAADDTTTLGLLAVTASAVAAAACMHACAVQRQWPLALAACASACLIHLLLLPPVLPVNTVSCVSSADEIYNAAEQRRQPTGHQCGIGCCSRLQNTRHMHFKRSCRSSS